MGNRAVATDANGETVAATTTDTELGYVNGVTSDLQTQIDTKLSNVFPTTIAALRAATFMGGPSVYDWFDDLDRFSTDFWVITHVGGGSVVNNSGYGGNLRLVTGALDNNSSQGQNSKAGVVLTASKKLWFICNFLVDVVSLTPDMMVGLATYDTTLITAGAGIAQCADYAGFVLDGGDSLLFRTQDALGVETENDTLIDLADGTSIEVAFYWDGVDTVTPYVNAVAKTAHTTNLPSGTVYPSLALQNGSGAARYIETSWTRVLMER